MTKKKNALKQARSSFNTGYKVTKSFFKIYKKYIKNVKKLIDLVDNKIIDLKWKKFSKIIISFLSLILGATLFVPIVALAIFDVKSK